MPRTVILDAEADLAGFRAHARALLQEGVEPGAVAWLTPEGNRQGRMAEADAVSRDRRSPAAPEASASAPPSTRPPTSGPPVPASFVALCAEVVCHRDPGRYDLLYRLLWRYVHEPALRSDPLDPDRVDAEQMARSVRRDCHKMKAFLRFRRVDGQPDDGAAAAIDGPARAASGIPAEALHVAWFEPEHHIVEAVAPFFARRFAQMRWAILTPERSVRWDGHALAFGPGADRREAPRADAGEALWLTYYEHIFNPARLKTAAMEREMPRRYWPNLPEARLIAPLVATATQRSTDMIDKGPTQPARRRPATVATPTEPNQPDPQSERPVSLADLAQAIDRCRECPIGEHATQGVPGEGPPDGVRLLFVGEQPGDQEDLRGRPFVGPAGQLLDRAFRDLGWPRDQVFVTNAVKHFKFELRGKRRIHKTPAQQEMAACLHWLDSEIALVRPEALVALGATAARQLMGRAVPVTRERGQWLTRADGLRVLITLHPSALLRTEPEDRDAAYAAWLDDLRQADRFFR